MTRKAADRYDAVTMAFHWGMALIIFALWGLGHVIEGMPKGPPRSEVLGLHKTMGVLVLVLVLARLMWRFTHDHIRPVPGTSSRDRLIAALVFAALYCLMLAIPLGGILMSQTGGHAVTLFGFELPILVDRDPALHELFEFTHQSFGWVLAMVVLAHVAAALRHHLIAKDDTLRRILPRQS